MLLLLLLPCAALGFVPVSSPFLAKKPAAPLTRRHFKIPTEPIPVVDTLEKKGNLTWALPGASRICCLVAMPR